MKKLSCSVSFSIVIPAYNASSTIIRSLESCINQSFLPQEITIIDDASTDDTYEQITKWKQGLSISLQSLVKTIRLEENKGVAFARNLGWDASSSQYIVFLDSDDYWSQDKLEILAQVLQKQPVDGMIFHSFINNGMFFSKQVSSVALRRYSFYKLLLRNKVQGSSMIISRTFPIRFDPTMRYCEDYDLALRMAHVGACYVLPLQLTVLGRRQTSSGGLSGNHYEMRKGELRAYGKISKQMTGKGLLYPILFLFSWLKHLRLHFKNSF